MTRSEGSANQIISLSLIFMHLSVLSRGGGGEGRAWDGDLIVFVGPGVGHLTNLVLPGEGIFESFFARRGEEFDCRLDGLMLMSFVLLQRL